MCNMAPVIVSLRLRGCNVFLDLNNWLLGAESREKDDEVLRTCEELGLLLIGWINPTRLELPHGFSSSDLCWIQCWPWAYALWVEVLPSGP